jgi:type VII secretion-associated serine protease mycosin
MTWVSASPRPRAEEWWFGTWEIQSKVWPISKGRGVTVAVVDTGVNARLPDLRGSVLPGTNITGPKGDGRIDLDKEGGHGTAMAALIVGQGLVTGMVGVAPEAKVLSIHADVEDLAVAVRYATDHGAQIINVSQGLASPPAAGGCDVDLQRAISNAVQRNIVLVAASGNDASVGVMNQEPALCPGFLAVGAVDHSFTPWADSQPAPYVAAAAPGVHVGSIGKTGAFIPDLDGTSQAAALTSGVAALIRSKFPTMPAREVVQRIIATARDVGAPGRDNQTGYGLIRPYHALVDQVPASASNPVFAAWDRTQPGSAVKTDRVPSAKRSSAMPQTAGNHGLGDFVRIGVTFVGCTILIATFAVTLIVRTRRRQTNTSI